VLINFVLKMEISQLSKEFKMKIKSFEDLQVWKDAREFVKSIYELTSSAKFNKDYGLKDQIQRAAVSIINNIAEGFERDNNKEFIKSLGYSKGSAGEIRSMLYVALDLNYITISNSLIMQLCNLVIM